MPWNFFSVQGFGMFFYSWLFLIILWTWTRICKKLQGLSLKKGLTIFLALQTVSCQKQDPTYVRVLHPPITLKPKEDFFKRAQKHFHQAHQDLGHDIQTLRKKMVQAMKVQKVSLSSLMAKIHAMAQKDLAIIDTIQHAITRKTPAQDKYYKGHPVFAGKLQKWAGTRWPGGKDQTLGPLRNDGILHDMFQPKYIQALRSRETFSLTQGYDATVFKTLLCYSWRALGFSCAELEAKVRFFYGAPVPTQVLAGTDFQHLTFLWQDRLDGNFYLGCPNIGYEYGAKPHMNIHQTFRWHNHQAFFKTSQLIHETQQKYQLYADHFHLIKALKHPAQDRALDCSSFIGWVYGLPLHITTKDFALAYELYEPFEHLQKSLKAGCYSAKIQGPLMDNLRKTLSWKDPNFPEGLGQASTNYLLDHFRPIALTDLRLGDCVVFFGKDQHHIAMFAGFGKNGQANYLHLSRKDKKHPQDKPEEGYLQGPIMCPADTQKMAFRPCAQTFWDLCLKEQPTTPPSKTKPSKPSPQ
jgi:hypothetical protein